MEGYPCTPFSSLVLRQIPQLVCYLNSFIVTSFAILQLALPTATCDSLTKQSKAVNGTERHKTKSKILYAVVTLTSVLSEK